MNRFVGLLTTCVVLQSALPSFAAVQEITSNDEHLHLYGASKEVSVVTSGWNKAGGGLTGFSGTVYSTYVTKGSIPISDDRFIELIEKNHVDEQLTNKVNAAKSTENIVGWTSVIVCVVGLAGGLAFGINNNYDYSLLSIIGGSSGLIGLGVAASMHYKRPFTDEEAYDAIQAYNKKLDERLEKTP